MLSVPAPAFVLLCVGAVVGALQVVFAVGYGVNALIERRRTVRYRREYRRALDQAEARDLIAWADKR